MTTLALVAQLRNAVLEWPKENSRILYFTSRSETDPSLLHTSENVARFNTRNYLRALRDPAVDVIELAEPMWITEWPRHYAAALVARVLRRKNVTIATYAIENLHWEARFSHPKLDRWPVLSRAVAGILRRIADWTASSVLDLTVFGSPGAEANYLISMPRLSARVPYHLMLDDLSLCACILRSEKMATSGSRVVQFLGENVERKGGDLLLEAWAHVRETASDSRDWKLRMSGPGFDPAESRSDIEFESRLDRECVYQRLAEADVVVAPSRRTPRWREQKGLSIIEGLRHGAHVLTTNETGLASVLRPRPDVVLVESDEPEAIARAIIAACRGTRRSRSLDLEFRHVDSTREQLWREIRLVAESET